MNDNITRLYYQTMCHKCLIITYNINTYPLLFLNMNLSGDMSCFCGFIEDTDDLSGVTLICLWPKDHHICSLRCFIYTHVCIHLT